MSEPDDVVASIGAILLVDPAGRVLLQLRDSTAPAYPDKWSLVGGHLEGAETPEEGARREVLEESALTVDGPLEPVYEGLLASGAGPGWVRWHVFAGPTAATDDQIVVGEGADIVFVRPEDALDLDLTPSAAKLLPEFLGSALHRSLADEAASARKRSPSTGGGDSP